MARIMFTLLVLSVVMIASTHAAQITFSGPVDAMNTSVLDVELDNPNYTFVEGVTYGSGAKTFTTAGGNSITLASDSGTGLGNADMPPATPNPTSGYYNAGTQWSSSLLASDTDVLGWTDSLKGNLWHNNASDAARPLTLHLAGLTIGQKYSVQLYSADARFTDREQAYWSSFSGGSFSGGTSGSFSQNPAYKVTGTFVADDIYQDIFIQETDEIGNDDTTLAVYTLYAVSEKVVDPNPSNGAENVPLTQNLGWTVIDPNVEFIDLCFGTENDPNLGTKPAYKKLSMEPVTTISYAPTLDYSTDYYWKINVYEPNTVPGATDYIMTAGPVWNFTTVGQAPQVTPVSPAITVVEAGQPAILSITGTNIEAYHWYKVGDVTPLSDDTKYAGTATDTLTINDVRLADEGQYYCQVTNTVYPDPVDSVPGTVMTMRLIIHYPLDTTTIVDGNEVTPDIESGYDMVLSSYVSQSGDGFDFPTLVTGVAELGGNGLFFNNSDPADPNNAWGQYATAGDVDMEAMGVGLTISFWAQWIGNNGDYQGIINRQNSWNAADMMWRIDKDPTTENISFGRNGSPQGTTTLNQNQWNFITITYDGSSVVKTYNNGELVDTDTGFTYGSGVNSDFKLGSNIIGDGFFYGIIDDVKIYNYVRTTEQVANDYLTVKSGWVCNNEGTADLTYDFDGNCQVDLGDFAMLAADWLNSNRIYAP